MKATEAGPLPRMDRRRERFDYETNVPRCETCKWREASNKFCAHPMNLFPVKVTSVCNFWTCRYSGATLE